MDLIASIVLIAMICTIAQAILRFAYRSFLRSRMQKCSSTEELTEDIIEIREKQPYT